MHEVICHGQGYGKTTLDNLIEMGKTHMGDFYTSKEKKGCLNLEVYGLCMQGGRETSLDSRIFDYTVRLD